MSFKQTSKREREWERRWGERDRERENQTEYLLPLQNKEYNISNGEVGKSLFQNRRRKQIGFNQPSAPFERDWKQTALRLQIWEAERQGDATIHFFLLTQRSMNFVSLILLENIKQLPCLQTLGLSTQKKNESHFTYPFNASLLFNSDKLYLIPRKFGWSLIGALRIYIKNYTWLYQSTF